MAAKIFHRQPEYTFSGQMVTWKKSQLEEYVQFIEKIKHTWNFIKPSCLWSVQKHFHRSMRPHCWWNNISLVINLLQMRCRQFIVSIASEIERMLSCKRITLKIWGLEALHEVKFKYEIECPMAVEHVTMIVEPSSRIPLLYFQLLLFYSRDLQFSFSWTSFQSRFKK